MAALTQEHDSTPFAYERYTKNGFKYRLTLGYETIVHCPARYHAMTPWCRVALVDHMRALVRLSVYEGYACDGPSGPTWDDPTSVRAAFIHDALYQLIRERQLPPHARKWADQVFYKVLLQDGMPWFRAKYYYHSVRLFGWYAARPKKD